MPQPSVLRRTRLVTLTLLCAIASVLVSENGWAQPASATVPRLSERGGDNAVALRGDDAIQRLKQEGTYDSLAEAVAASAYALARVDPTASPDDTGAYEAPNPAQALNTHFTGDGVRVRSRGEREWQLGLKLTGWGYGEHLPAVTSGRIQVQGNRIEILKHALGSPEASSLVEWYVNTPQGLEQGFTLPAPPDTIPHAGAPRRLRLALELTGDLRAEATGNGQAVRLTDRRGREVASYDHLKAWDAAGRALPSRMQVAGGEVSLEVDDAGATYPVTIDPTLTQEVKLTAGNGVAFDEFGFAVAISGNTAIVGTQFRGAVYIFVRNGPTWLQQQKLPVVDAPSESFGQSVAISGNTAIVGATAPDGGRGRAYVFARRGTTWSQQSVLTASDRVADDRFGYSVAISGDTVVVGAPYKDNRQGAAYIFVRTGETWAAPEQAKLLAAGGEALDGFGWSVGISGETVIVGAFDDNVVGNTLVREGSADVFVRSGTTWAQQAYLTAPFDRVTAGFGWSVGISGDTVLVGTHPGVDALLFTRSGTLWSLQQALRPNPTEGSPGDGYGESVAISGDRAIVGAWITANYRGAAYVFTRDAGTWNEQAKLTASDAPAGTGPAESYFGYSVAVSDDISIVGAHAKQVETKRFQGGAYVFQTLDRDGDGLPDDWETNGLTIEGVFIDLPRMGADPLHKDIFVHADWMGQDPSRPSVIFKPKAAAIKMVIDAFATAPVNNPDGKTGVNLHVDAGPDSIMNPVTGITWAELSLPGQPPLSRAGQVLFKEALGSLEFGEATEANYNWSDADAIKATRFKQAKRGSTFHYALFCNQLSGLDNSGLSRGLPSGDFLVALGQKKRNPGGTEIQQAATFMHELGHNLGLLHGGRDPINNKPNYISIMNYKFQLTGLLRPNGQPRHIDYSRSPLPPLDEGALKENDGISDPDLHLTLWSEFTNTNIPSGSNKCIGNANTYNTALPSPALDWNCDGVKASTPVKADINGDGVCVSKGTADVLITIPAGDDQDINGEVITAGPDRQCDTAKTGNNTQEQKVGYIQPDELTGFEDWPVLDYGGGGRIAALGAIEFDSVLTLSDEPTLEQLLRSVPPALFDEDEAAPLDVVTVSTQAGVAPLTVTFDGGASTALNGTIVDWAWDFGDGTTGSGATIPHIYGTPGDYFASLIVTDTNGHVNLVPLLQRVVVLDPTIATPTPVETPIAQANLTLYQPAGAADKVVVSNTTGTHTDGSPLVATDTLFVDFAILNNGTASTSVPFTAKLYVDGTEVHSFAVNPLTAFAYFYHEDFSIGALGAGPHSIKIVADANAEIAESDETDNEYSKGINVLPSGSTPTRTPTPSTSARTPTPTSIATPVAPTSTALVPTPPSTPTSTAPTATPSSPPTPALGPGDVDPRFAATVTENVGEIAEVITQPDGKIIVGGLFESIGGCIGNGVARINADGRCDPTFDSASALPNGYRAEEIVGALALQPDGKVLVGFSYSKHASTVNNNLDRRALVRLNPDGTLDSSFDASGLEVLSAGADVESIGVQSNGKIVVGGSFEYSANTRYGLVRLNADGSVDESFTSMLPFPPRGCFTVFDGIDSGGCAARVLVRGDDRILIYGSFGFRSSVGAFGQNIARLNADGSHDASFDANLLTTAFPPKFTYIHSLSLQSGDQVIAAGDLFAGDGVTKVHIARLNSDGTRDASFVDAFVPANDFLGVFARRMSAAQSDGKVIVSGRFDLVSPERQIQIARLNTDGTLDTSFDVYRAGIGDAVEGQFVNDVALQTNGKVVIVGSFHNSRGVPAEEIVQVNSDGSPDPLFDSNGPGRHTVLHTLVRQPDGKLLVGYGAAGLINNRLNAVRLSGIGRLNADGTTDRTFTSPFDVGSNVVHIVFQAGKIIVGGEFYVHGSREPLTIARLNTNGTLDPGFVGPSGAGYASDIAVQVDGKLITLVGSSSTAAHIGRLNQDGSRDDTFPVVTVPGLYVIKSQPDGRLLVAGQFSAIGRNSQYLERSNIARLNDDGSFDTTFNPGAGSGGEAFLSEVRTLIVQPDKKIIIGGDFSSFDGTVRDRVARLDADGRLDTSFNPVNPDARSTNEGIDALALDAEGRVVVQSLYYAGPAFGRYNRVFRLNQDGSLDSSFGLGTAETSDAEVNAIVIQPDHTILIGGNFAGFNGVPRLSIVRLLGSDSAPPTSENCYDCIDNDGDGKVDRDDTECPQRANGMQSGLRLPGKGAKTIAKCAKTLGKAGPKFSAARLKHLQQCVNAAFVCVQQKPNDAACAAKAQKTCGKELDKAAADESKLRQAILKACDNPAVDVADLRSVAGIGYDTELAVCAERGVGSLASASDVADCLIAQHRCRVEDLVASEVPRAVELLRLAGRDPAVQFPCLVAGADGAGGDLGAAKGKLAVKCQKTIGKAGAKFASLKAKLTQKCLSAVYVCVQVKPTDTKCRPKAAATCNKQLAKLSAPVKGAAAKLAAAITKGCSKAPLTLEDLLGNEGLGFAALGDECAALDVPSLDSLANVSTCLEHRHTCRVEQMIETEMPRVEELLEVTP